MTISGKCVPMRWPAGPLEAGLREKNGGLSAEAKETIQKWLNPAALKILSGSPVNCLVVAWAAGTPLDAAQQQALAPLVRQASAAGLVWWVWWSPRPPVAPRLPPPKLLG